MKKTFTALFAGLALAGCKNPLSSDSGSTFESQHAPGYQTPAPQSGSNCSSSGLQLTECTAPASSYWAAAAASGATGTDGSLSVTIPAGYHTGATSATAQDADLLAANIKSGVSIFGVAGSLTAAYANCSSAGSQGASCTAASGTYWASSAASGTTTGTDGSLTVTIPNGYHAGSSSTAAQDTDLVAGNVKTGVSIFGVTGSLIAAYTDCSSAGSQGANCTATSGSYWTSSAGSNVALSTASSATIPAGYQSGSNTCSVTDANLSGSNIKSGVSILGVAGTYDTITLQSNMSRNSSAVQLTQTAEVTTYAGNNTLPAGYRAIPDITKDDDGNTGGSVTKVDRTGWSTTTCGTAGTIAQRIADCAANATLGAQATWNGSTKGNAGQATWKLVTRTGDLTSSMGREVWQDQRTGLMWSSQVSRALYWCKAAGSNNIGGNPFAQNDPSAYCTSATYQNTSGQAVSACYEDDGTYFTTTDAGIDNAGKAGLNLTSTPAVAWRLPTFYDYNQANVDGIRFVLPDMATGPTNEWSATVFTANRTNAWVFIAASGAYQLTNTNTVRTNTYAVRCVGR